jgi:NAD(P)-dependent dehydrogenase (short-subunit alcohol dehydrogenase family)
MARVFITGSADGLGRAAAQTLLLLGLLILPGCDERRLEGRPVSLRFRLTGRGR